MLSLISLRKTMDSMIPITRFNRGEAGKIFDELKVSGCKVVVKNNIPACVMLTPEIYQKVVDIIEDHYLLSIVEERADSDTDSTYSFEELLDKDGLTLADLDALEDVEIE